ncbi:uncharacterized protein LY89DRAFT_780000 [Mollisia scopiformis]|uniref:DUF2423 domain-containing protein n=1 Tax=Mollisia scopiformis TaxID=149040 RepID=A0A194XJ62_MOLSC|nr:uncharacterized protein LY89DRAFT_780000 [Mollisia scopiformis]KUJ20161.1 hypothetical protein LY89DRAFT_780000 [Mollisia scopiformis]
MAKGARASTRKANNVRLKSKVFSPVESARVERLSAKLLELASQPKPEPAKEDVVMDAEDSAREGGDAVLDADNKQTEDMELDQDPATSRSKSTGKGRIEKRRSSRKTSIVFPKYKNGKRIGKPKGKK